MLHADVEMFVNSTEGWLSFAYQQIKFLQNSTLIATQKRYHYKNIKALASNPPDLTHLDISHAAKNKLLTSLQYIDQLNANALKKLGLKLAGMVGDYKQFLQAQDQESYKAWVDKILNPQQGYRQAHNYIRGEAHAPPLPQEVETPQGILSSPGDKAAHFKEVWADLWTQRDIEALTSLYQQLRQLIGDIHQGDMVPITSEDVAEGLKAIKLDTTLGIDFWGPKELRQIEELGLEDLALLLNNCEQAKAWPLHIL